MTWHIIEGEAGCAYARDHDCVAIVVDALRASATAAMLLNVGAVELYMVGTVEDAFVARAAFPDALLFGERGGLPPKGFDFGNSPREVAAAAGRSIIFTTTTGSTRVLQAQGAHAVYMGTTVNALGVLRAVLAHERDIVLIPAGKLDDPEFDAQEDWIAASAIAMLADATVEEGALWYREWRQRIELDGVPRLFEAAPHAAHLRKVDLGEDIAFCARMNVTDAVPLAREITEFGVRMVNATN
ncbi:MAG: 2-phosphosulfolactate phosphatase [Candidatus Hydrogenedentes bacterium]|nr:2-phosphosulfolactate phosphatase [Candidatus Hydrogenedentota bacterium]